MSPPTTPHVVPADADISDHPMTLQVLDLSTSNPALLSIKGPESLSSLWGVLTRCKRSLKDGERLENISWRLWYQACVNASISHGHSQSALDYHPLSPTSSRERGRESTSANTGPNRKFTGHLNVSDSESWMSDGVESSDSEAPVVAAEKTKASSGQHFISGPSNQAASEAVVEDDDYETEESFSPEIPPPPPSSTGQASKSETSIPGSKAKITPPGVHTSIRAKKGHGRQKSIGGRDKLILAKRKSDGKRVQKDPVSDERSKPKSPVARQASNEDHEDAPTPESTAEAATTDERVQSNSANATTKPITAPKQVTSTTYSSSTPKASSYPTPSASYVPSQTHSGMSSANASVKPPTGISRTRSHGESGAASRHSHSGRLEGQSVWGQWRRAGERSFGEVVDDVFKVIRVEDLVPKRVHSREVSLPADGDVQMRDFAVPQQQSAAPAEALTNKPSLSTEESGPIHWGEPSRPLRILQEDISPKATPGLQAVYHESPLQMADAPLSGQQTAYPLIVAPPDQTSESSPKDDMAAVPAGSLQTGNLTSPNSAVSMGPIVRVVEPTPAPSRVGSAGEISPLGGRLLASSAISQGLSRKDQRQQANDDVSLHNQDGKAARRISGTVQFQPMTPLEQKHATDDLKPAPVRRLSSARSNQSSGSSSAYTPGSPMVERENPMEAAGLQQATPSSHGTAIESLESAGLSGSVVQRLNDSATARPRKNSVKHSRHAEHQVQHGHSQSSGKKSKKSIFFIQSPGESRNRRSSGRKGSVSGGSEASTEADGTSFAGSTVGLPSSAAKSPSMRRSTSGSYAATSPLAKEVVRMAADDVHRVGAVQGEKPAEVTPLNPRTTSEPSATVTHRRASAGSKHSSAASGMRRTSSTAHANTHGYGHGHGHGHGHAHGHGHRTSVHHLTQVAGGQGKNHTTAAANLGAAKRTDSMSNMAGRLREMKANAAAAISARLAAQQKAEKERLAEQRKKLSAAKRQQSEPDMLAVQQSLLREAVEEADQAENDEDYEDVDDDTAGGEDDDDAWSSATDESAKNTGLVIGKAKPKPKRDPAAIAAAKAAAAEADAQRKRELFAKRAIFGPGGMSGMSTVKPSAPQSDSKSIPIPAASSSISRPGGLTNLFEKQRDVLRRADSMVDVAEPSHSVPPRVHATEGTRQREGTSPALGFNLMNRSKSAVALPIASGVSVTTGGLILSGPSPEPTEMESRTTPIRGKLRLPPKPAEDADFSPSSSPENTSALLATSEAVRRLEALSSKRRPSARSNPSNEAVDHAQPTSPVGKPATSSIASVMSPKGQTGALASQLERTQSHPMAIQPSVQFVEPALPQTPATRRRQMLATELPEDLRLNLLFERRSGAAAYPKSQLRATASVHDLPETGRDAEFASAEMSRQTSHDPMTQASFKKTPSPNGPAQPPPRRRSGPNLLSGGNLLRPLTSASTANVANTGPSNTAEQKPQTQQQFTSAGRQPLQRDQRSKSTANVADLSRVDAHRGFGFQGWGGPDFKRRSTEGDGRDPTAAEQRMARLKALRDREGELSSSFRSHGW